MTSVTSSAPSASATASRASATGVGGLSLASVGVFGFFFLVALPRPAIPLIDGDVWWHIRAGQEVLSDRAIPSVDSWTIVSAGREWISQDWLSNVMLAVGYDLGEWGPTLLSIGFSLLVVASLWLLWRAIGTRCPEAGWLSRIVWLAAGLTVAGPVVGVRVQVVDLLLAAAVVVVLWHFMAHRRVAVLMWLPLISLAWANLHAGWLLLFLLGGAVVVGEAVDRVSGRRQAAVPLRWTEIGWLGGAMVVSLAAIGLNPNGIALYAYPFETSAIQAHRDFLAEWSSPDIGSLPGQLLAAFVALGIIPTFVLAWRHMRLADALVLGGLTVMALVAARFLIVVGPIGAAIIAVNLAPVVSRSVVGRQTGAVLRRMASAPPSRGLAAVNLGLAAAIMASGIAVTIARTSPGAQADAIGEHMPVAAVDWILANDPGERPFNTYAWGGYLGIRRPDTLVYIDGRSDVHGDAPIRSYADAISLRSNPQALLDEHQIDHVVFNTTHAFADWLNESADWDRAYTDEMASVWIRRGAAP